MSFSDFLESMRPPDGQASSAYQQNYSETGQNGRTTDTTEAASDSSMGHYEELHPTEPFIFGSGPGFTDVFNMDRHAEKRRENLYYPFSSKGEWGLASWLLCSGLSMRAIDDFLALPIVRCKPSLFDLLLIKNQIRQLSLSFASAKTLRTRMEDLPKAPAWKMQEISLNRYLTAKPTILFYHNPLECIQALLRNPTFEGKWTFSTRWVYEDPN